MNKHVLSLVAATMLGCAADAGGPAPTNDSAGATSSSGGATGAGGTNAPSTGGRRYGAGGGVAGTGSAPTTDTGGIGAGGRAPVAIGCDPAAQEPGKWKNVTPPGLNPTAGWGGCQTILLDPARPSDMYLNCDFQGTWKSTDCGVTWTKTNTGLNSAKVDGGRQWSAVIDANPARDPNTPPTLYVTLGYGAGGVWRSSNGGVDWTDVWTDNIFDGSTNISTDVGADVALIYGIEPSDPNHLIAVLHTYWGTGNNNGIFETTDGGGKWLVHKSQTFTFQNHADTMFPIDETTWEVSHILTYPNVDLYRTTDSGGSWNLVSGVGYISNIVGIGSQLLKLGPTIYVPSNQGAVYKSTDRGASWTKIPVAFQQVFTVFANATDLYVAGGKDLWDRNFKIQHAPLQNDTVWVDDPVPAGLTFAGGIGSGVPGWGVTTSDGSHTILVTSNYTDGAWRYVVPE